MLKLDWQEIFLVHDDSLPLVLQKHSKVFEEGLGTLTGFQAKIVVDPSAQPKFCKARTVPYFLRDRVEKELNRLVDEGTLETVEVSDWASPIISVLKPDKVNVRICGDFKQTVNPVSTLDKYPIPKVEDLFATLAGGKIFSKIDLSQAYQQFPLADESKQYVVINTHKGLFRYTRLPFGVSSAPGIFQRVMENVLQGIPNVVVYLDDILLSSANTSDHLKLIDQVLDRLEKTGLRARKEKCEFFADSVAYLGHKIDSEGLHPLPDKVEAIQNARVPTNVQELRAYLGLLTYYSRFLPNLSTVLSPLNQLLQKSAKWKWTATEHKAFVSSKELLLSSRLLVHFDPSIKLTLAVDASTYGLGAVLAHKYPNGSERPIGYASRSLSSAEKNYSQIEKEGLACVFGVNKFRSYLLGHSFELVTDHKPLLSLFHQHKATSAQASARIRRWSLTLSAYEYTIVFRGTNQHSNADALSRLPLSTTPTEVPMAPELVLLLDHLANSPVTVNGIRTWTRRDPVLAQVLQFVEQGWPNHCDSTLSAYSSRKTELSVLDGCILWGSRVVVPENGRHVVLQKLHSAHPGMTKMKALARMYVWWPGLETDIEESVRLCNECQLNQSNPPTAPLNPWNWPSRPWARLHIDYAGPFESRYLLILIDAHSKWIEAFPAASPSSSVTIDLLRSVFAQFGLPETIVSDNGSCFVSEEFQQFLKSNGVKQVNSAPYHPSSNGLAERAVQIVKKGLKKTTDGTIKSRIARVLFAYRNTPHCTTGNSPAKLLLGRQLRTRLDLLKPNTAAQVESKQLNQKISRQFSATKTVCKWSVSVSSCLQSTMQVDTWQNP